jgi:transcriptional regulator GlxA family with amidase domain
VKSSNISLSDNRLAPNGFEHTNTPKKNTCRRIGFLGFDGVRAADITGPLEAFTTSRSVSQASESGQRYEVIIIGLTQKGFVSESGIAFRASETTQTVGLLDSVIVPGGSGLREAVMPVSAWLARRAPRLRRIAAICDGVYPLAQSGLLDGRTVTTHWRFAQDLARRFPALKVKTNASFLKDGPFYTCGSGTGAIELAISLIREDCGSEFALALAREMVVRLRRPGEREAQLDVSSWRAATGERIAELPGWIAGHLECDLSERALAQRAGVSARHLRRLFKAAYNKSPAELVEQLRLREAGRRLHSSHNNIAGIAFAVGYASPDVFRRAFQRWTGVSPRKYRTAFCSGVLTGSTTE